MLRRNNLEDNVDSTESPRVEIFEIQVVMDGPGLKAQAQPGPALKSPGQARPKPYSGPCLGPGLRFSKPKPGPEAQALLCKISRLL
jgi:hypothetical protein